jgi:hypothetical protein
MRVLKAAVVVLALAGALACATSAPGTGEALRPFPSADFSSALAAVLDAVAAMDAKVLSAGTDEGAGVGRVLVLADWRTPQPESPVLRIELRRSAGGIRVDVAAEALGTVFERLRRGDPTETRETLPPDVCRPCEDHLGSADLTGTGNASALARLRRARRAFLQAWQRRLARR